jgi:hypothetical protein
MLVKILFYSDTMSDAPHDEGYRKCRFITSCFDTFGKIHYCNNHWQIALNG